MNKYASVFQVKFKSPILQQMLIFFIPQSILGQLEALEPNLFSPSYNIDPEQTE